MPKIKAYANMHEEFMKGNVTLIGCSKLDDLFELLAWNQRIGNFSSEIGPSGYVKNREDYSGD